MPKSGQSRPLGGPTTPTASPKWWVRLGRWIESRGDTFAALVVGIAAAVLAFLDEIKTVEKLAIATLTVLVVVALALVIERERRLKESRRIDEILREITRTGDAVEVLASPTPYHVVVNESVWDISANGDAKGTRLKHLRFSQDDVVAGIDWYRGDGDIDDVEYLVGEATPVEKTPINDQRSSLRAAKVIHEFPSRGRDCRLVAFDRAYMRDEERDFLVIRSAAGLFPKNPDRIWVIALESTSLVRVVLRWTDRLPIEVRLIRQTDSRAGKPLKFKPNLLTDGRAEFRAEVPEPRIGERIGVEWDWPPDDELAVAASPEKASRKAK